MIELCIIGNSHIIPLKEGWLGAGSATKGFKPTYFASHGEEFADLEIWKGNLLPATQQLEAQLRKTSEGRSRIEPQAYDAFVLAGLSMSVVRAARIYRTHRLDEHVSNRYALISPSCLREAIVGMMENSLMVETVRKLKTISTAPIYVVPSPAPTVAAAQSERFWTGAYAPLLYRVYGEAISDICNRLKVSLCTQSDSTLEKGCFTSEKYTPPESDKRGKRYRLYHANDRYGVDMLKRLLPQIASQLEN